MEIKSSSEESQLTALRAKSLLPLKSMNEFAAQEEPPTTTKRPSEFSLPRVVGTGGGQSQRALLVLRIVRD